MNSSKNERIRIGIDLGGTKIEMIALDSEGEILALQRIPTPAGDYEKTIRAVAGLVLDFEKENRLSTSVGLGMPGAISPANGMVKNSNSVCLNGRPFKQDLETVLKRTVKIENDANCFALSGAAERGIRGRKKASPGALVRSDEKLGTRGDCEFKSCPGSQA